MKNRTTLTLIELSIMLLVFALTAALCLQAFAWADSQSQLTTNRDTALLQAQSAAETLKHHHGDLSAAADSTGGSIQESRWLIFFDENWSPVSDASAYTLEVSKKASQTPCLGTAEVSVRQADGTVLVTLNICWQEVAEHG